MYKTPLSVEVPVCIHTLQSTRPYIFKRDLQWETSRHKVEYLNFHANAIHAQWGDRVPAKTIYFNRVNR